MSGRKRGFSKLNLGSVRTPRPRDGSSSAAPRSLQTSCAGVDTTGVMLRKYYGLGLFLACALAESACSGGARSLIAGAAMSGSTSSADAMNELMPKSVSPGTIKVPPMPKTTKLPPSAMLRLTPPRITPQSLGSLAWNPFPGAAIQIVASPDRSLWALATAPAGANKTVWQYQYGSWNNIPGSAGQIAVGTDGTLYAVNAATDSAYAYYAGQWESIAGGVSAVTAAADGSLYFLATSGASGGNSPI